MCNNPYQKTVLWVSLKLHCGGMDLIPSEIVSNPGDIGPNPALSGQSAMLSVFNDISERMPWHIETLPLCWRSPVIKEMLLTSQSAPGYSLPPCDTDCQVTLTLNMLRFVSDVVC